MANEEELKKKKGTPDARTYYHKGNVYFEKSNYEKAIENYNMAIILNPNFSEAYFSRGLSYYNLKNFTKSARDYTKSMELDPNNPVIYNNRGDAYYRKQEFDKSIKDYDKALTLNPRYLKAYYNRGLAYACKQNYETAIEDFNKVVELNPNFSEAYHVRGLAYDYMNQLDKALEDYDKSIELNPNFAEAKQHRDLAKSKMEGGDYATSSIGGSGQKGKGVNAAKLLTKPDMSFEDVAGMKKLKELIRENIVYPMMKPDLARKYGKLGGGGLMLYGPPGCGKTFLMKAAAGECKASFMNVKLSDVLDQYVGGTEKNIHNIFETARKNAPCIVFVDEIDALGGRRDKMGESGQYMKAAVNQLLYEMDGVEANNEDVLVVGATNAPWDVDPALRRSGRLGKTIYVGEPDFTSRKAILKLHSKKRPLGKAIGWNRLTIATYGYASADLKAIVDDASAIPWREAFHKGNERNVGMGDFLKALKKKNSSLPPWYAQANKQIGQQEEKSIVDGKEHVKISESKMGPAEKAAFKELLTIIKKNNKLYYKVYKKVVRYFGLYFPIPI